jgi:hypothetical protein
LFVASLASRSVYEDIEEQCDIVGVLNKQKRTVMTTRYATSRKVVSSKPPEAIEFFILSYFSRRTRP